MWARVWGLQMDLPAVREAPGGDLTPRKGLLGALGPFGISRCWQTSSANRPRVPLVMTAPAGLSRAADFMQSLSRGKTHRARRRLWQRLQGTRPNFPGRSTVPAPRKHPGPPTRVALPEPPQPPEPGSLQTASELGSDSHRLSPGRMHPRHPCPEVTASPPRPYFISVMSFHR